jgi:hypothetical protein
VEYLVLAVAVAAVAALLVFLRKRASHANARFEPTEAQETWGGPEGQFPDTVVANTAQSDFNTTLPGLR